MSTARTHTRSKITVNICLCICLLWPIYSCTRIYYAKEHSHIGLLIYYCKGSRLLALRRDKRTKNVRAKRVLCRVREYLTKSDEFAQTHLLDLRAQSRTEDYTRNGQELLKWNCRNMRAKEVHLPASGGLFEMCVLTGHSKRLVYVFKMNFQVECTQIMCIHQPRARLCEITRRVQFI